MPQRIDFDVAPVNSPFVTTPNALPFEDLGIWAKSIVPARRTALSAGLRARGGVQAAH